MKILFVIHQYLPRHCAGTEVYTHSLVRELSKRHEVSVYCHEPALDGGSVPYVSETYEGIQVRRVAAWVAGHKPRPWDVFRNSYRNPVIEADFCRMLADLRPDVLHVQHLKDLSVGILGRARMHRVPMAMTLHDYWAMCPNAQRIRPDGTICTGTHWHLECGYCTSARLGIPLLRAGAPFLIPFFGARDRYVQRQMSHVGRFIAPSAFLRNQYIAAGYPADNILLLENGLDLSRITSSGPRPGFRGHYAFIGSLAWQKGVHVLIDAFRGLDAPHAQLRIWGDLKVFPDYSSELRKHAADHPGISFEGVIPPARVGEALVWADYLVVPSLWWENSPVTIQEAYAAGVPVITSKLGALPEKVVDGQSGLLFEPGSAASLRRVLRRTCKDAGLVDRLRSGLPEVVGIAEHARLIERIYRDLAKET